MRRILLLIFWQFILLTGGRLFADVVTLKDGRQISGLVESGNIQELHIKVGDQSQTVDIHEVQAIQFGVSLPAPPAAPPPPKAADLAAEPAPSAVPPALKAGAPPHAARQPPTSAPAGTISLGSGAEIAVGTTDGADSNKASLDDPIPLDGAEVAPTQANAFLPVTDVKSAVTGCGRVETGSVESRAGSQVELTLTGTLAGAGAATGAAADGGAAAIRTGAVALPFAGELIGKGLKNALESPFINRLTQPGFINSKRSCQ